MDKEQRQLKTKFNNILEQSTGTENYYQHWTKKLVYTDGVKEMAEFENGQYWIIDLIASYQFLKNYNDNFQQWEFITLDNELKADKIKPYMKLLLDTIKNNEAENPDALAVCTDGNGKVLITQKIPYTNLPTDYLKLYLIDNVLMLPSEY